MLELPKRTLETIRKYLLNEQIKADETLKQVKKDDPVLSQAVAESSEPGTDSWIAEQHQRAQALGVELQNKARNVRLALTKLRNGSYGRCERCGKYIEIGRLLAMPTAKYCLSCSKKTPKI